MSEYLKFLKSPKDEIIVPFFDTLMRSAPDSLVLGTVLLSLMTQSYAYSILLFAFMEIIISHYVIASLISYISGGQGAYLPDKCGFQIPSYSQVSILKSLLRASQFPTAPTFFMSAVIAYIFGSTMNMRNEIADLAQKNPILNSRFPISVVLGVIFLCSFVVWRITNGCDTLMGGIGSVLLGMIVGGIFMVANSYAFGRESINFTGLPLLVSSLSTGKPIYACGQMDPNQPLPVTTDDSCPTTGPTGPTEVPSTVSTEPKVTNTMDLSEVKNLNSH